MSRCAAELGFAGIHCLAMHGTSISNCQYCASKSCSQFKCSLIILEADFLLLKVAKKMESAHILCYSQHLRSEFPSLTGPLGSDQPRSSDNVLGRPNARPAMIHSGLIGHGIVGLHLHGVVRRGWAVLPKDLIAAGIRTIFHATLEIVAFLVPMPTLLMDMSKEMHFCLAPVDGTPQLLAGTPAATRRGIEDTHGPIVGHQDVHAFGHVIIVVAREGIPTARGPTSTPDLETQHFHQVMVQHLGICNLLLEVVGTVCR
mmetsp:Transcript_13698/g.16873  ORF Transcript_13698/g.16873 Transcript_13698/m.16873 type:complete len:258 (-) Transcript_13698:425-1198(-)